jgi:N-acetylated-alpha-linked acidic dipeptidase
VSSQFLALFIGMEIHGVACSLARAGRSVPNAASALNTSRQYASKPHIAGSPADLESAKTFLSLLQTELGIDPPASDSPLPIFPAGSHESRAATLSIPYTKSPRAWIDVYYPMLNLPLDRSLHILGEDGEPVWTADLEEHSDETDPEAAKFASAISAFHGLSKGGEVEGKLVYANHGNQEDYDELVAKGE